MEAALNHYLQFGWAVLDLIDPRPVQEARQALEIELVKLTGKKTSLEDYHLIAQDDAQHTQWQSHMHNFFHEKKFARKIISAQKSFFEKLIGGDLLVQEKPYLRLTRPFKRQDNIGYHRDTFYGGSPYEVSVLVPYVNLEPESSLSVMDGSHILSEKLFPTVQIQNPDSEITKGSQKHKMGFPYAPKVLDPSFEANMRPIPLKIGQALFFSLSTLHGSVENRGRNTRWSTDIRVLNALAPVDLSARPQYYERLALTPATASAQQYFVENAAHV